MERKQITWTGLIALGLVTLVGAGYLISINVSNTTSHTQGDTITNEGSTTTIIHQEVSPTWTPVPTPSAPSVAIESTATPSDPLLALASTPDTDPPATAVAEPSITATTSIASPTAIPTLTSTPTVVSTSTPTLIPTEKPAPQPEVEGPDLSTPAPDPTAEIIPQDLTYPESADPVATEVLDTPPSATYQDAIVELTNQRRDAGGLCGSYEPLAMAEHDYSPGAQALSVDDVLTASAQAHAEYMADTLVFEHQTIEALREAKANGENIGVFWGPQPVAETFVEGWIESPGHCHNLMTPGWEQIGVGVAQAANGDWFGVQLFRGKRLVIEVDSGGNQVSVINAIAALSVEERLEVFRWAIEETWREVQYAATQVDDHSCKGIPLDKVLSAEVRAAYADDPTAGPGYFELEFPAQYATLILEPDLWGISTDPAQFVGCDEYTSAIWIAAVYGGSAAIGTRE